MKENLVSYSHNEWQPLSVHELWMCALRKPYIRSLNLNGFKTHDFSVIDMIIKTKQMFFGRVSKVRTKAQPYSGKGGGEQQLICI